MTSNPQNHSQKSTRPKHNNKGGINPILLILLGTLIVLALAGIIIFAMGYRYITTDNAKFSGWTKNGQPTNGKISYLDGSKATLTMEKDGINGKIIYSTGDIYIGTIQGINRHGKGEITYKESGNVYTGEFVNDKRTGNAIIKYKNGDLFEGKVSDGKMNGLGKYSYADGSWYYGEFKDNMRNGVGEYHWADNTYYYGTYLNNKRSGTETVTITLNDGTKYVGECKLVFSNGDKYVGDFIEDHRTGYGTYEWPTGEKYIGEFDKGRLEGNGTYYYANGDVVSGDFIGGSLKDDENLPAPIKPTVQE